ncbi:MAG: flippase-like domain-containing protein [Sandaracinaceae bacterium]|nr:flippase-like domain-containing protein [Sandaracinaceae bacterium]
MTDANEHEAPSSRWDRLKAIGRWLLLAVGVGAVVYLVYDAGPALVWRTLAAAAVFLPFVALGELGFVGMDVVSLRMMYGRHAQRVPASVWLRSALMAYGIMILLPAGRAGGEVMRAAGLAPYVGGPRAAAGAALLQGVTLFGNTLISIPCYVAVAAASSPTSVLALLVLGNGVVTGLIGTVLLFGARFSGLGGWLGKRVGALAAHGAKFDASLREMPRAPIGPIAAAGAGRVFQAAQYGVILVAVGGSLTLGNALIAQAIHLVGAGLGDMVPNQAGITETAYRLSASFAPTLGLSDAAAQMIAIALLHRIVQFSLAGVSLAVGAVWKPAPAPEEQPAGA